MSMAGLIGQSLRRREDRSLLLGAAAFVEDLSLSDMVWLSFLRSPHAHARIRGIDASRALAQPGVVAVLTGRDIHPRFPTYPTLSLQGYGGVAAPYYLIATDKTRHVGEVVALVLAEDRYRARDAVDLISVDYEVLPAAVNPEEALRPDAPRVHDDRANEVIAWHQQTGDVAQAFEEADLIIRERVVNGRIHPVPLEPRAGMAHWDPTEQNLCVWASTQTPHDLKEQLSKVLDLPQEAVRVVAPEVGGGFGAKAHGDPEYILLAIASQQVAGRPVKWVATRAEEFLAMHHGRGKVSHFEVAATKDGRVTGIRLRHIADLGAYPKGPEASSAITSAIISVGAYHIRAVEIEAHAVYTNRTPCAPYRGAGRPEGIFLIETAMDRLAAELDMDPAEVRRRNYIPPGAFPYRTPGGDVYDSGRYEEALNRALQVSGYRELREEQERLRTQGRYLGIGLSSWVKSGGFGPSSLEPNDSMWEWARVRMAEDGGVTVYTGASPHGQGTETTFAQIAADVLRIPAGDVSVVHGDTSLVPYGMGTHSSRNVAVGGAAVYNAAQKVLSKLRRIAAYQLAVLPEEIRVEDGAFIAGERRMTVREAARAAYLLRERPPDVEYGLDESAFFQPAGLTFDSGTYVAVVEVDPETGDVHVLQFFCVDDAGVVVNPLLAEGQIHGGVAQGIGQALYEAVVYDDTGQLLTGSLMDYAVPTAEMVPLFVTARVETPSPFNPLGAKGLGEGATTGTPPAIVNAVVDALKPFGVDHVEMPLTPERVWRAIRQAGN